MSQIGLKLRVQTIERILNECMGNVKQTVSLVSDLHTRKRARQTNSPPYLQSKFALGLCFRERSNAKLFGVFEISRFGQGILPRFAGRAN
jgi:hypothetical protein